MVFSLIVSKFVYKQIQNFIMTMGVEVHWLDYVVHKDYKTQKKKKKNTAHKEQMLPSQNKCYNTKYKLPDRQ